MFMDQEDKEFRLQIAQYAIDQVGAEDTEWVELADLLIAFVENDIVLEEEEEDALN
jgi:hypothetical protein